MFVKKISGKIVQNVWLAQATLNIFNVKQTLIDKININIAEKLNHNYKTNVQGKMTDWMLFNSDKIFIEKLNEGLHIIANEIQLDSCYLKEAWGIKIEKEDFTRFHNHNENYYSGVLYLNKVNFPISFPEIDLNIKPEEGTFLLFSSLLLHGTEKNTDNISKYAIAFNMGQKKDW